MGDCITLEEPNGVEEVAIDIGESVVAMQRRLHENRDGIRGRSSEGKQIWNRVPHSLTGIHPTAVQPELVSIGPYHYHLGKNELLEFERYKWWFLNRLLSRTKRRDVRDLFEAAKKLEESTRKCYDDDYIPMSSSDFVEMMVLDGCFIVELFRHVCRNEDVKGQDDPILSMPWLIPILTRDLLKLENQLPFFVLRTLFNLTVTAGAVGDPLPLLALKFFNLSLPRPNDEVLKTKSGGFPESHLLALFHSSFQPFNLSQEAAIFSAKIIKEERRKQILKGEDDIFSRDQQLQLVPELPRVAFPQLPPLGVSLLRSVSILQSLFSLIPWPANNSQEYRPILSIQSTTQLRPSGVKFRPHKADSFLSIKFKNRVLQIPPITINDLTITFFINCIAYEQYRSIKCFTSYIAFLSCLINSPRDVAFLCADGIITSYSHNDHYIAGLFNKLGEKIYLNKTDRYCYLSHQFRDVEAYYCSHWGTFLRTYFSSPWSFISIFSASVLLLLTALQTVMAILGYINKGP